MSRDNICKNCKYWTKENKTNPDYSLPLETNFNNYEFLVRFCDNPKLVYTGMGGEIEIDGLGYFDDESYVAILYTGEEFGCIHFKGKENEPTQDD